MSPVTVLTCPLCKTRFEIKLSPEELETNPAEKPEASPSEAAPMEEGLTVVCPTCGTVWQESLKGTVNDWYEVYQEDVHRPLAKKRGGGEKADRTHSRRRALLRKLWKLRRQGGDIW